MIEESSDRLPSPKAGKAENEIELTPWMIEAGADLLRDYFYAELLELPVSPEELCSQLFHAMVSRRKDS